MSNLNQNKDEGAEFLESIQYVSSVPDPEFKDRLEAKMLKKLNSSNTLFNFFPNMSQFTFQSAKFRFAMFVTALVLVGGGLGGYYFFATNQTKKENGNLTDEQILAKIVENNSADTISPTSRLTVDNTVSSFAESDSSLKVAPFYSDDFNYQTSTTTFKAGPKNDSCGSYYFFGADEGENKYSSFYDKDTGVFYTKYASFDSEGNVYDYSLMNADKAYNYKGGSYATYSDIDNTYTLLDQTSFEATDEDVNSDVTSSETEELPEDSKNSISDFFGESAKILGTETVEGKEYYVIEWTSDAFCGDSVEDSFNSNLIYNQALVDSTTFEIVRQEEYFESVSEGNLIKSYSTTSEKSETTLSEVQDEFEFEYDVELKKLEDMNYDMGSEEFLEAVGQFLQDEQINFPTLTNDLGLSYFYSQFVNLPGIKYYESFEDRAYYLPGKLGDALYEEYMDITDLSDSFPVSLMTLSYTDNNSGKSISIDVYSPEADAVNLAEFYSGFTINEPENVSVSVDSQAVPATLYKMEFEDVKPVEEGDAAASEPCVGCNKPSFLITFEFEGKKYYVNAYGYDTFDNDLSNDLVLNLERYDDSAAIERVKDLLKESAKNSNQEILY